MPWVESYCTANVSVVESLSAEREKRRGRALSPVLTVRSPVVHPTAGKPALTYLEPALRWSRRQEHHHHLAFAVCDLAMRSPTLVSSPGTPAAATAFILMTVRSGVRRGRWASPKLTRPRANNPAA